MFNQIKKLAQAKNRKIMLLDVKTTSSIKEPDFGIIDVTTFLFFPDPLREPSLKTTVINPEVAIDRKQSRFTGLTDTQVMSAPTWEEVAKYIKTLLDQNTLLVSYNPYTFLAIADQGHRYQHPLTLGKDNHLNLKALAEEIHGKKDHMDAYLKKYAITRKKHTFDRASYRVKEAAQLLDAILSDHGLNVIHKKTEQDRKQSLKEKRADFVKHYVELHGYNTQTLNQIQALDHELFPSATFVSFAITDALISNKISYDAVANEDQQQQILDIVDNFLEIYPDGKLTPILKEIHSQGMTDIDFIQLRVAMNRVQHNNTLAPTLS